MSSFIPITALSTTANQTQNDSFEAELENTSPNFNPSFAKFTVKTIKSDECLSSPLCKLITERDIKERIILFYDNEEHLLNDFKGSQNPRNFVFSEKDNETYWKNEEPLQIDTVVIADEQHSKKSIIEKLNFEYSDGCSTYLNIGKRVDCIITIYPDYSDSFSSIR